MARDPYRDTLLYALAIAGGERKLAAHLRVGDDQLKDWLDGVERVPEGVFQSALDLIIHSSPQAIFRSRGLLLRMAR